MIEEGVDSAIGANLVWTLCKPRFRMHKTHTQLWPSIARESSISNIQPNSGANMDGVDMAINGFQDLNIKAAPAIEVPALDTLYPVPKLPFEVRQKIWGHALPGARVLEVLTHQRMWLFSLGPS